MPGKLILAANSLGGINDIPPATLEAVRTSDVLVFEEVRRARAVLKQAGIFREFLRFTEHHEHETLEDIVRAWQQNLTVCYVPDQGVPTLADPGRILIQRARQYGACLKVIPGPSSVTVALAACSFDISEFYFAGFLPRDSHKRRERLQLLAPLGVPLVILEAPYRLHALLNDVAQVFPALQPLFMAVDLSGPHESYFEGPLKDALKWARNLAKRKLNFVLVIDGSST